MNNRIKELLKESTESRWYCGQEHNEVDQEKFAQLIVRECAAICINEIADPRDTVEQRCAAKIIKHFGVEL